MVNPRRNPGDFLRASGKWCFRFLFKNLGSLLNYIEGCIAQNETVSSILELDFLQSGQLSFRLMIQFLD